jgi:hypothetical protein
VGSVSPQPQRRRRRGEGEGRRKKEGEEEKRRGGGRDMQQKSYKMCNKKKINMKLNSPLIVFMRLSRSPSVDDAVSASSGMSIMLTLASLRHLCARTALFRFSSRFCMYHFRKKNKIRHYARFEVLTAVT